MNFTPDQLEHLAAAAHDIWADGKKEEGFVYAPVTDKAAKKHACLIPYPELSETDKESDRALIRGIPAILEKAGYRIVPATNLIMADLKSPHGVSVEISGNGKTVWVTVDGICRLRAQNVGSVGVLDRRPL